MQHRKQGTRSTANLISPHCHKYHCAEQLAMKTQHYITVVCSTSSQNRKVEKKKSNPASYKRTCRTKTHVPFANGSGSPKTYHSIHSDNWHTRLHR